MADARETARDEKSKIEIESFIIIAASVNDCYWPLVRREPFKMRLELRGISCFSQRFPAERYCIIFNEDAR